ncbi:hypothetical protein [Terrarubrum flagellatum]|uniref:hypothetical protein n=1 Tax=Terrirubrum flagellatum TaxID=2895980 RepID=UPI0031450CE1
MSVNGPSYQNRPQVVIDIGNADKVRPDGEFEAALRKTQQALVQVLPYYLECAMGREEYLKLKIGTPNFDAYLSNFAWKMIGYARQNDRDQFQDGVNRQVYQITPTDFSDSERKYISEILQHIRFTPHRRMPQAGHEGVVLLMGKLWKKALNFAHGGEEKYTKRVLEDIAKQPNATTGVRG